MILTVHNKDELNNGQWFNRVAAVLELMKGADTGIEANVNLGANVKDILESEEPLVSQVHKGFQAIAELRLPVNFKKILFSLLKEEGMMDKKEVAAGFGSVWLSLALGIKGSLELEFDDYEELVSHPMMEPFLLTFAQLIEQAGMEEDEEELCDPEAVNDIQTKKKTEWANLLLEVLKNHKGGVEFTASMPKLLAVRASVETEDISKFLSMGVK
jgi:hypothetical protein